MGIKYTPEQRTFHLTCGDCSYIMAIVDEEGFLGHVYYGKRLKDADVTYLLRTEEPPFVPSVNARDRGSFMDAFPCEYAGHGLGDYRDGCVRVRSTDGATAVGLYYVSHEIYAGKPALAGLPATFGTEADCTTLELTCRDPHLGLTVVLLYTAFEQVGAITRSVRFVNDGAEPFVLEKALSCCVDFDGMEYDMITLHGSWARERQVQRRPVGQGVSGCGSLRGESGHQNAPFLGLLAKNATEDTGDVYGFHLVYSGNFLAQAEGSQFDSVRVTMGIHPTDFAWTLAQGETFQAPEVVLVYSDAGLGKMTRIFHDLYRNHLIRGKYKDKKRPILINNWEATYFNFDTDKLLAIAQEASQLGIEMLVMDDGWFGARSSDNMALGDWVVNEDKLKGGLSYLVSEVNKLGMKFGIWFEPEMISPDSDLYRAHPDWAIAIPGRTGVLSRNQYVLDYSRAEVRDAIYEMLHKVLTSANIEYVKWDMNRQLTDLHSAALPAERQGELFHRYVLGVYALMERLTAEFPDLLLENCSGGGARFDPGMLYYSPQIWCSDDTDAIARLSIQRGTAMLFPLSTIGAHVSDCPNHTVGRTTPFETRGIVALAGTFGYELDVTRIPAEDRAQIPAQVARYHKYNDLVRTGDYYRIANYDDNGAFDCYAVVAKDQSEALMTFVQVLGRPNHKSRRVCLKGLDAAARYRLEEGGSETDRARTYAGDALMNAGFLVQVHGDFQARLYHFVRE